jgi:predicted MPP superfamily phosphohydrolase
MDDDCEWITKRREIERGRYLVGPTGRRSRFSGMTYNALLALFGLGLRLTPFHAIGRRNALDIRLRRHDIRISGLPTRFDGYRLLHVSDSHFDVCPELVERTRDLVAGLEADLLVFTGDTLGYSDTPAGRAADLLAKALEGANILGHRLAILGNHDPTEMVAELERIGFDVLVNRTLEVRRGEDRLLVTGLDDVHSFYTQQAMGTLTRAIEGCAIALVHSSELADHAAAAGYSLYLSGHTHGGQIALPGGRPMITHLSRCRHTAVGIWRHDRLIGYTSCGLGVSPPGVRFNTRGEVALLTLRCAD